MRVVDSQYGTVCFAVSKYTVASVVLEAGLTISR
jgi:hypothetical protein